MGADTPTAPIRKRYFSWGQIHETCVKSVARLLDEFNPTMLVPISGGGLIPARLIRSGIKQTTGKTLPTQVVGAYHYDDDAAVVHEKVIRTQWLSPDAPINGARMLLVDEVDDSRKTLAFIVAEMLRYFDEAEADYQKSRGPDSPEWSRPQLAVYVIHNKVRPKEAVIDPEVFPLRYFAGENTPNFWHIYPWDAPEISSHTAIAEAQEHYFRERPAELALAMQASSGLLPTHAASAAVHYADGGSTAAPVSVVSTTTPRLTPLQSAGGKPVSALTSALSGPVPAQQGEAAAGEGAVEPLPEAAMPRVSSGVWRASPDGMYFNMGPVPPGLEPRFGSLTLVDSGRSVLGAATTGRR